MTTTHAQSCKRLVFFLLTETIITLSGFIGLHGAFAAEASEPGTGDIGEVLVTAEKRSERLQDVPVPVTVLSADALVSNNQVLLRDYYASVPGLAVTPDITGQQLLSLRGITTGQGAPTVGILIDDVPFGAAAGLFSNSVPDFDPNDLARVEVLRGPQGTLYGDNSMGGLIKYVTKTPSTTEYSGRFEAGTSNIHNGADQGLSLRAAANIPLSSTFAIRVSGYRRQDPGYVDNPSLNLKGVNDAEAGGARIAALWRPSDDFSLKLSALYQHYKSNGSSDFVAGLGDLQNNYVAGSGGTNRAVQAYSAILNYKLWGVDIISITGYNINQIKTSADATATYNQLTQQTFGVPGTPYYVAQNLKKITQEIRLSAPIWQNVEWLIGGFYTHERTCDCTDFLGATNPTTGELVGKLLNFHYLGADPAFEEYSAFGDLTYHVSERIDVQIGARETHIRRTTPPDEQTGAFVSKFEGAPVIITPANVADSNSFTYLLTPRFRVSSNLMMYARLASGYRPGGSNGSTPGVPSQYGPDKTYNYEIGAKADFLNNALSIDTSVYYIDWKDIQIFLIAPNNLSYQGNGGRAKSEGIELSVEGRPWPGLTVKGWFDYDNAVLTDSFGIGAYGAPGYRLPYSTRFSGNFSLEQDFRLWNGGTGFFGGQASFVGNRLGIFASSPTIPRQYYPSYTKTDLRAGARFGSWTGSVYVNNVADVRGVLSGGLGYFAANSFSYIQPRTAGLTITKIF